jgi:predicted AAA+ superfamily ATPase
MRDLLETIIVESAELIVSSDLGNLRQYVFPHADNMIKTAIGMRRTGKTFFLHQTMHALLKQGVSLERMLFINFDDDRLLPMNAQMMGQLIDQFYAIYPDNHDQLCYLFLDEVQNIPDWHLVVRRYFDTKKVQLYITGSSAKLLSTDIHTRLRGRSLSLEIWPYSFAEYVATQKISINKKIMGQATLDKLHQSMQQYFSVGGFPAVQILPEYEWRETLQGYVDTVILKDIVERYRIENIALLKYLTTTLLKNAATIFSINKFYNDCKSLGFKIGKETIYNYLEYIQDAFLTFTVPIYTHSDRVIQNKPKKIYAVDPGLVNALSLQSDRNRGRLFENMIYLDLRRQHKKIYFYQTQSGYEVDFLTIDPSGVRELIQACWDSADVKTLAREERALREAEEELGISGKIITPKEYYRMFL